MKVSIISTNRESFPQVCIPIGAACVAAALREQGHQVEILDLCFEPDVEATLTTHLDRFAPEVVAISLRILENNELFYYRSYLADTRSIVETVKRRSRATIVVGGATFSLFPEELMRYLEVPYGVAGDGEESFPLLVRHLQGKGDLSSIPGICYREGTRVIVSPPARIRDFSGLPFPAYDLVDTHKYSNLLACTSQSVVIMTSRGCPQRCAFCDMRRTTYRFRSPANIMEEIKFWTQRGVKEFFIQDDNFTINRARTIEFCKLLIEANLGIAYKISSRVDYLDDEIMGYLKSSGCYSIYFGVESGSQRVLNHLEKGITVEQTKDVFRIARKHGIDRCAYIMIGCPSEEKADIEMTMRLVKDIRPEHLHCSVCAPMPRTYLYQKLLNEGLITHDYWLEFARNPDPSFRTPFFSQFFSSDELRNMQNSIQRQFYMDPRIILREIRKTRDIKQFLAKAMMAFRVIFR